MEHSFYNIYEKYKNSDVASFLGSVGDDAVIRAVAAEFPSEYDFLALLSERASFHLETLARRAQELTLRNFGRVIQLYTPLYLANFCENECVYCSFRRGNPIPRKKLSLEEVKKEAVVISAGGIRHILILTGDSRRETPVSYLRECAAVVRNYFTQISLEVYPLNEDEYGILIEAGIDGLTLYQETYDEEVYRRFHPRGPKSDFRYRLEAPDRACRAAPPARRAGMRFIGIGALLGLAPWRREAFFTGLHAAYLQKQYPQAEISVSLPRIQPHEGSFTAGFSVSDKELVQMMLALRLFLPRAGITISTRENNSFRGNLIGLGVTRMSAGSRTDVGGYASGERGTGQFEVADKSAVVEVKKMIYAKGYQPVLKDWGQI